MSDNNLNSPSDSHTLDADNPYSKDEELLNSIFSRREKAISLDNSKLPQSIEVLTTTDSSTSPVQDFLNLASSSSMNFEPESPQSQLSLVDDSELGLSKESSVVSTKRSERYESTSSILSSIFGNELSVKILFYMVVFVITNTAQPMLVSLKNNKQRLDFTLKKTWRNAGTYTFLFPTYLAMVFVGAYPTKKSIFQEKWRYPILLSVMDILHQVVEKAGLVYCGPSIYSIASSTNTLFLALFSKILLKQTVTSLTWLSISLISFSLGLSGYVQIDYITPLHILGFFLVIFASMVSALNSVIGEILLKKDEIEGPNLVCIMGLTSLTIFTVWSMVWTIPQRKTLFATDKDINPFDLQNVISILAFLLLSNFGRSSVYYYIIKKCGSVCCGVLKALRIVLVVFADHFLFSYIDGGHRLTLGKILAALICTSGVMFYSLEKAELYSKKKPE